MLSNYSNYMYIQESYELLCAGELVCLVDGPRIYLMRELDDELCSSTTVEFGNIHALFDHCHCVCV